MENSRRKKIFIIAGESSGDLLGSKIMKSIKENDEKVAVDFVGIGGEKMEKYGLNSIFPMQDLSVMGLLEVISRCLKLLARILQTVRAIESEKPDLILTIDSPDFCFRVMKKLKKRNIELFNKFKKVHLIAPSVWAYREKRAAKIAKLYDLLLCILPFEPPYFEKYGLKSVFIGHPIFDNDDKLKNKSSRAELLKSYNIPNDDVVIILTPGSREHEIEEIYPVMIKSINTLRNNISDLNYEDFHIFTFVNNNTKDLVKFMTYEYEFDTKIISNEIEKQKIMDMANVVLAKSGTNTLEFNMSGLPLVITYKFNWITNKIVKRLVKVKFANLVNIMANREVIPEFILDNADPYLIAEKLNTLLKNKQLAKDQVEESRNIIKDLGYNSKIKASKVGAEKIVELMLRDDLLI